MFQNLFVVEKYVKQNDHINNRNHYDRVHVIAVVA